MEVATTNNHSQSHHHHHHNHHLGNGSAAGGVNAVSRSPFQREVREWQRIDPDTGALLSGRLEADRWINGPLNSYGKISDSQNISQPNGTQHIQRKQMEVLRSANGAMQVIRTQTVQKSSSTSRWATSTSTSSTTTTTRSTGVPPKALWAPTSPQGVDICELSSDDDNHLNVVDESTQSDAGVVHECTTTASMASNNGQELVDDHVDFVVINGRASMDDDDDDVDDDDDDNDKLGHNLLPDTAPSLKLSNLMKSSSSISSQSSNNSNLTIATGNTHRNAGKISLHAIVGQAATTTTAATSSSSSSLSTNTLSSSTLPTWPKQPDIYGSNNKSSKRRVGVPTEAQAVTAGNAGNAGDAADVVATPTLRRDLESFRHYNDDDADADDLRLSARHQRRQQVSQSVYAPPLPLSSSCSLQRSRSISTDDLSNEWQQQHKPGEDDDEDQPCGDWRRVSKLRRSFQSQDYHNRTTPRSRPLDLPSSSTVSVARIRAELENGRRLNTAMRNNHVDLAALDNILNTTPQQQSSSSSSKPQLVKKSTFLTAESLQEIRGKLKKLSDESLYKEDFLAHQTVLKPAPVEVLEAPSTTTTTLSVTPSAFRAVHNTHSLETRQRPKDTNSSEWHLRRKSYGFEKMSPPENRSIFRVDASTDSGLGRSGEQLGNWSPTERSAVAASGQNATIIHFGRRKEQLQQQQHPVGKFVNADETEHLSKRHSIAVEETWRDLRKTSQVRVNGDPINGNNNNSSQMQRSSAQKRVEFCKTEVHFAAESGRVNIVETDGKPPPTQNFRRRRRTASGPLQSLVKSASVSSSTTTSSSSTISSGDGANKSIASSTVTYRATLMEPPKLVTQPVTGTQVTVVTSAPKLTVEPRYSLLETTSSTSRHSYTSTSGVDTTDNENDELANIRGILKNKPVKPKPYHLGENIESAEVLWSVPATAKSESRENSPPSRESATEDGHSPVTIKSVAERVRIVEQRQFDKQQMQSSPAGNGYSTKINVSLGAEEWPETDLPKSNVMNIALHAPRVQKPQATPPTLRIGQLVPVAKPRTLLVQPQLQAPHTDTTDESGSESLKIVKEARGARKLREHELSYFGVQSSPTPSATQSHKLLGTPSSNPRRTLPTRSKHIHNEEVINATTTTKATTATAAAAATTTTTTKWQLLNDRPDLLRHSPQGNDECNDDFLDDEEHCYENIANELTTTFRVKSPSPSLGSYERKTDLQRDAQILSEMTRNADQTMKALSDEAAFKDQRRRSCSLQRRIAKPLATIDERVKAQAVDAKSVSVTRGTFSSEARRNSRQSTPSPTRARSSSQSSIECCPRDRSRSSSRESMTQGGGSSDEQLSKQRVERLRMRTPKREKSRQDPITEQRSSRQSSKPRNSNSNSNEVSESKRTHHHSRHSRESREKEHSHTSEQHSGKHSSGLGSSRLLRSSRVGEESRPRTSSQRTSEREKERVREGERARERERSRGSEKHKEELTRSRGHSSRSRHSEPSTVAHKSSRSSRSNQVTNTSTHRKSVKPTTAAATPTTTAGSTTKANTTASHKTSTATSSAPTATTHNELTHGKSTLNGHAHHHHNHHSSKHSQGQRPQHHVHSLTTTTIAATKQQRDRHGKDRK